MWVVFTEGLLCPIWVCGCHTQLSCHLNPQQDLSTSWWAPADWCWCGILSSRWEAGSSEAQELLQRYESLLLLLLQLGNSRSGGTSSDLLYYVWLSVRKKKMRPGLLNRCITNPEVNVWNSVLKGLVFSLLFVLIWGFSKISILEGKNPPFIWFLASLFSHPIFLVQSMVFRLKWPFFCSCYLPFTYSHEEQPLLL